MSIRRLRTRCANARFISSGFVEHYIFKFNKKSTIGGGSGKGNIVESANKNDIVWGAVFEIPRSEETAIDDAEGLSGGGYEKIQIQVKTTSNEEIDAITYIATNPHFLDDYEQPFDWYKNHCVIGAKEIGLPDSYVHWLSAFTSKADLKISRVRKETAIYF